MGFIIHLRNVLPEWQEKESKKKKKKKKKTAEKQVGFKAAGSCKERLFKTIQATDNHGSIHVNSDGTTVLCQEPLGRD